MATVYPGYCSEGIYCPEVFFPPRHAPRSLPAGVAAALFRSRRTARYLSDGAGANSRHRHFFIALGTVKIVALYRGNRQAHSMLTCRACHQNLSNRHIFSPFGAEHKEDEMSTRSPDACENKQPLFDTPEQGRAEKRSRPCLGRITEGIRRYSIIP